MNMTQLILTGLAGLTLLSSCTQYQAQGAGVGALAGGALGAIAGDDHRDVLRGAALGAAVGTGVTALQESERRKAEADAEYNRDGQNRESGYDTPPPPTQPSSRGDYPVAEKTANPDRVISPYGPNYNVIDVSGFHSGQLARDPSNQKIFRVP